MTTTNNQSINFQLSDGYIEITHDKLIINDKANKDRLLLLAMIISGIVLSVSILYKWTNSNDNYYLVMGNLILISNLGLLRKWYKEFNFIDRQIYFNNIDYFKLVNIKLSDTKVGLIRTKNKKFRRLKMDLNDLDLFRQYLFQKNINVIS